MRQPRRRELYNAVRGFYVGDLALSFTGTNCIKKGLPGKLILGQSCNKIIDLDLKDQDHLIDLDLLGDLDHCW